MLETLAIYNNIKRIAKAKGASINSIEKNNGLGSGSIAKWNTVSPTARSLKLVADYLGVTVDALLETGKEESKTES